MTRARPGVTALTDAELRRSKVDVRTGDLPEMIVEQIIANLLSCRSALRRITRVPLADDPSATAYEAAQIAKRALNPHGARRRKGGR